MMKFIDKPMPQKIKYDEETSTKLEEILATSEKERQEVDEENKEIEMVQKTNEIDLKRWGQKNYNNWSYRSNSANKSQFESLPNKI